MTGPVGIINPGRIGSVVSVALPRVLSSTLGGSEFQAEVKKIPSPSYTPKHMEIGLGPPRPDLTQVMAWVTTPPRKESKDGAGFRGFSYPA